MGPEEDTQCPTPSLFASSPRDLKLAQRALDPPISNRSLFVELRFQACSRSQAAFHPASADLNSGPRGCPTRALTHEAITPASHIFSVTLNDTFSKSAGSNQPSNELLICIFTSGKARYSFEIVAFQLQGLLFTHFPLLFLYTNIFFLELIKTSASLSFILKLSIAVI